MNLECSRIVLLVAAVTVLGGLGWFLLGHQASDEGGRSVEVVVPQLTDVAARGRIAFEQNCASCHGINAGGTQQGPPLVHPIYNPGHHADGAFFLAAKSGVRQHHWNFGNMPPQPQVSDAQIAAITRYVRELQAANGIIEKLHPM
jgi:mono/diheme cytochrome c family protein